MLPKLYRIAHPKTPFQVVFVAPDGKRVRRHFADEAKAKAYHRALLAKAKVAGTAGLVLDEEMRAEYFAARRALGGESIMTAVRYYLRHRPAGVGQTLLADLFETFLQDKRRMGRAVATLDALKSAVSAFLVASDAVVAADFTREAVTRYLDGLRCPPLTLRTHRARLSAFGEWMARRQFIPENPVRYIEVAHYDPRPPRIATPEEVQRVMQFAKEYRGGIFAPMYAVAFFAGLRHGEILRLTWSDLRIEGPEPIIRVGQGKIRGRRAVRVVPICPALLSWLTWAKGKGIPLVNASSDSRKVRQVIDWQDDIARHSWISYRLALVGDEVKVAREAGNSPDMIYRHYFRLVSAGEAVDFFDAFRLI